LAARRWLQRASRRQPVRAAAHLGCRGHQCKCFVRRRPDARAASDQGARAADAWRETDLYFRVADNAAELPYLAHAELKPIPSIWGHRAGNPATNPVDARFVKDAVRDWLAR